MLIATLIGTFHDKITQLRKQIFHTVISLSLSFPESMKAIIHLYSMNGSQSENRERVFEREREREKKLRLAWLWNVGYVSHLWANFVKKLIFLHFNRLNFLISWLIVCSISFLLCVCFFFFSGLSVFIIQSIVFIHFCEVPWTYRDDFELEILDISNTRFEFTHRVNHGIQFINHFQCIYNSY